MPDYINHLDCYFGEGQAPWIGCERYGVIPHILRIEEGITHVGANAFESLVAFVWFIYLKLWKVLEI